MNVTEFNDTGNIDDFGLLPTGFEAAPYIGAFNTTDWTATWANFDPQNADYEAK